MVTCQASLAWSLRARHIAGSDSVTTRTSADEKASAISVGGSSRSTDEEQAVYLDLWYPDVEAELNRWLPLVKWLLVLPHYIVLAFLWLAGFLCVVAAWLAILLTGRYPRGLIGFVTGVLRWTLRVWAYAFLLTTDRYPPFSLSSEPRSA